MPEKIITLIGSLPFVMLMSDEKGHKFVQLNKARIIEALIISCITGVVAGGVAGKLSLTKLEVKMDIIEKKVDQLDNRLWQYKGKVIYIPDKPFNMNAYIRKDNS